VKRVAILQSNYIPWKGYFDIIHRVDEFILYDDVQYTKNDWRNRNLIKTSQGKKWLTIPVTVGSLHDKINEVRIADAGWGVRHWETIRNNYRHAPFFRDYHETFERLFLNATEPLLCTINYRFLAAMLEILGVQTRLTQSTEYGSLAGRSTERVVNLCRAAGATHYLSGPAAKAYIVPEEFAAAAIAVEYMDYTGYPEYEQLYPPFDHGVSVIDLILTAGPQAPDFIWGWRNAAVSPLRTAAEGGHR
jgi:hypothetical protein